MSPLKRRRPGSCDPAPSRWAWRMQRLMLTPAFLLFLRAGVPLALIVGTATWWLSEEANRQAIRDAVAEARASFETRPEFMVQLMAIDGGDDALAAAIREVVPLDFPVSSFDLDLTTIRDTVAALPPVKSVGVRIRPGGVLQVDVTPRTPVAIWRSAAGLTLIDITGTHLAQLDKRMERADLPLLAGKGAEAEVEEALALYRAAAPLGSRLRGIVRMGERRWDVVLDRNQRILLPEEGAVEALDRVIALDAAQDMLARDLLRVDLRLGARPTVQMSEQAAALWWEIKNTSGQ
ncbi:cell division protein FtsQ/DivIB [Roseobacter sinensis]|uniref:Cell division protein FtsQ n=1 Tax=Roseobacter sinensis TaxID=2931391 RepID=A0ABT3BJZ8_9RHOB|nr:cell division protein FtsQ/DivIB [Roseobacter sp. WL0113]MCV3273903.1 cell division protein FtsQ/DivIB [Roseobacter sp. WL0113]